MSEKFWTLVVVATLVTALIITAMVLFGFNGLLFGATMLIFGLFTLPLFYEL